jgi:hypothetical protein
MYIHGEFALTNTTMTLSNVVAISNNAGDGV